MAHMEIIRGTLAEELRNSKHLLKKYGLALKSVPRGSLVEKTIKGRKYHYLAKRAGKKVEFIYQGRLNSRQIAECKEAQKQRVQYRRLISGLKKQILFIQRALHERKRRSV